MYCIFLSWICKKMNRNVDMINFTSISCYPYYTPWILFLFYIWNSDCHIEMASFLHELRLNLPSSNVLGHIIWINSFYICRFFLKKVFLGHPNVVAICVVDCGLFLILKPINKNFMTPYWYPLGIFLISPRKKTQGS